MSLILLPAENFTHQFFSKDVLAQYYLHKHIKFQLNPASQWRFNNNITDLATRIIRKAQQIKPNKPDHLIKLQNKTKLQNFQKRQQPSGGKGERMIWVVIIPSSSINLKSKTCKKTNKTTPFINLFLCRHSYTKSNFIRKKFQ